MTNLGQKTKTSRFKSKEHLNWVRQLGCSVQSRECNGPIQAHHLMKPWDGERGMGMKANDKNVVPLCFFHHHVLHTQFGDEYKFFESYVDDSEYGKKLAQTLYEQSCWANNKEVIYES